MNKEQRRIVKYMDEIKKKVEPYHLRLYGSNGPGGSQSFYDEDNNLLQFSGREWEFVERLLDKLGGVGFEKKERPECPACKGIGHVTEEANMPRAGQVVMCSSCGGEG